MRSALTLLALLLLASPGLGEIPADLEERFELLARDVHHTAFLSSSGPPPPRAGSVGDYEARAGLVALVRMPTLGIFAVRGNNGLLVEDLEITTPDQAMAPFLAAFGAGGEEVRIDGLRIAFASPGGQEGASLVARHGFYKDGVLRLKEGWLEKEGRKIPFAQAILSADDRELRLPDGSLVRVR